MDNAIVELLQRARVETPDAWRFALRPKPGDDVRARLVELLARRIAAHLCEPSVDAFTHWTARFDGGPPHPPEIAEELAAYLMSDFDPDPKKDPDGTRLGGAVVEHLWAAVAEDLEGGWGRPLHVEHDHFSVIDHGPDGVSIYDLDDHPELGFRLWESKRHASDDKSVTDTVTTAAGQLAADAPRYLARISKPLQTHVDERVRMLAGRIVGRWTAAEDTCAVGVSVGRSAGQPLPKRPFQGLRKKFGYEDAARREGVIFDIDDLDGFAQDVRAAVLRGIL